MSSSAQICFTARELCDAALRVRERCFVVRDPESGHLGVSFVVDQRLQCLGSLPPLHPEWLGDRSFNEAHAARFPYVVGAMAQGIASPAMVAGLARTQILGFFGAAGLSLAAIDGGLAAIDADAGPNAPWGANLIHSPDDPALENATADLYVARAVRNVSASAFMRIEPSVVRIAAAGLGVDPDGRIRRKHHVFAKISRSEVARPFMEPAPGEILHALVRSGRLSAQEAELAARIPLAEDVTVEADSGGHTDNRPLGPLLSVILEERDRAVQRAGGGRIRVGAAGGLATPSAIAAAFASGADYVLTGSINQSAVDSGQSERVRRLLAQATLADVVMAPAADMFEIGARVQVLKRGTLFGLRAQKLHALYLRYETLGDIPATEREAVERDVFRASFDVVWRQTREFWSRRDPAKLQEAERDPRAKMALVFRWYLGKSSAWARAGDPDRVTDYQIWCGPAMGAFNQWVEGSFLEHPDQRTSLEIALNLMEGAAVVTRAQQLRSAGVPMPAEAFRFHPRPLARFENAA